MPQNSITLGGGGGTDCISISYDAYISITISKSPFNFERVQI